MIVYEGTSCKLGVDGGNWNFEIRLYESTLFDDGALDD